jgi:hypothetical protein
MRMHMRRFTRLTNAFWKKIDNHIHMVALYTVWYNYVRQHKTQGLSPAMAAGYQRQALVYRQSGRNDRCDVAGIGQARAVQEATGLKFQTETLPALGLQLASSFFQNKRETSRDL